MLEKVTRNIYIYIRMILKTKLHSVTLYPFVTLDGFEGHCTHNQTR